MGVKLNHFAVTVATAGTRVQVTSGSIYCTQLIFEGKTGISGNVFIGNSGVSSSNYSMALSAGERQVISLGGSPVRPSDSNGGPEFQLNTFYVDAQTSGAIVMVTYVQRIGNS